MFCGVFMMALSEFRLQSTDAELRLIKDLSSVLVSKYILPSLMSKTSQKQPSKLECICTTLMKTLTLQIG